MGLYARVFCRAANAPTMRAAFAAANTPEPVFVLPDETPLDDPSWSQINLTFEPTGSWATLECDRLRDGDLALAEIAEFAESIGEPGRSRNKKLILEHLNATQFVVSCQLPFGYPDALWGAVERLLDHVVVHHQGLLQVDAVGFYLGERLVWKEG